MSLIPLLNTISKGPFTLGCLVFFGEIFMRCYPFYEETNLQKAQLRVTVTVLENDKRFKNIPVIIRTVCVLYFVLLSKRQILGFEENLEVHFTIALLTFKMLMTVW